LPITKETKAEIYQNYLDILGKAQGMIVAEYHNMQMKTFNDIRNALRPLGGQFAVVKNTIFRIALREKGFAAPKDLLSGPVAVAIARTDIAKVAKAMLTAAKDSQFLSLKGAILGENVYKANQLEAVSTMPTVDEARAIFLGLLATPAQQLVTLFATPGQELVGILKSYGDKLEGGEAA